jgi:aryl-alcohol dehydrogenase-like predicted oxidoreductase
MPEGTRLRRLGRVDLELTPAGLGGAPLGNLGVAMPDDQAADLVASAWEDGVPLGAAAAQFPLGHPAITSVVLGARRRQQEAVNRTFMTHSIPDALWSALKADGLLPASVPVPSASTAA